MTNREELMYIIMNKLHQNNVPLVFKGALVTKAFLSESNFNAFSRETQDIDANWTGAKMTTEELRERIDTAINESGQRYVVETAREYAENRTAGFRIKDNEGRDLIKVDVDMRPYSGDNKTYVVGNARFTGVTVDQIITDKLSVISSDKVFRRAKDVADLYALSKCTEISADRIKDMAEKNGRKFGDFSAFDNRKDDLEHAYNKLKGMENKPPFEEVYQGIARLSKPFRTNRTMQDNNLVSQPVAVASDDQSGGSIWVRPHKRNGKPVRGHWRNK